MSLRKTWFGFMLVTVLLFQFSAMAQELADDQKLSDLTVGELKALINHQIEVRLLQHRLKGDAMRAQIEEGILAFVKKQNEARDPNRLAKNMVPVDPDRDHIRGNPDAVISLVEYSDFECPFCKRFHPVVMQLIDEYEGQLNWVYRHFPLQFHNPHAERQALASECAGELAGSDAFWSYADALYERTRSNKGFPIENLAPLAVELGLDGPEFDKCMQEDRHMDRIRRDLAEGAKAGVSGTPGNILIHHPSGEVLAVPGALPIEELRKAVNVLLEKQG